MQKLAALAFLSLAMATASAQTPPGGAIHIQNARARATAPGQPVAGGYLKLINPGTSADRLLSASTPIAKTVELHTMSMDGDVMKMRPVPAIDIPAGQSVELKPGGLHIMFMGLSAPLKAGDRFPLQLRFEKAGELIVQMDVQAQEAAAGAASHSHSH